MELMKKIEQLKPVDLKCNFFTVYDYDGYTIQELLCQFFTAISSCINEINKVGDLVYWLVNEGLSLEVAKKLELWLNDGTLEKIINETIFKDLNDKLNNNIKISNNLINYDDVLIGCFFESNNNNNTSIYKIDKNFNIEKIKDNLFNGRDANIKYFNNCWIISTTGFSNSHDFEIYKSYDLINFEKIYVSLGFNDSTMKTWAPELFVDNDKLYVSVSHQVGTSLDIDNKNISDFRIYISECTDFDTMKFSYARKLELEESNKIDSCIIKKENVYYLFVKDEFDKYHEIWSSSDLVEWVKITDKINNIPQYTEGVSVANYKDLYYLVVDKFGGDNGLCYYSKSNDLINWSECMLMNTNERLRHGSLLTVNDKFAISDINKTKFSNSPIKNKIFRDGYISLNDLSTNGVVENFEPIKDCIYLVNNNENISINSINIINKIEKFYVCISTNSRGSLTINTNNISLPNGYRYDAEYGDNDVLIEFIFDNKINKYRTNIKSNYFLINNKKPYRDKECANRVDLTENQATLNIIDNYVYVVSGNNNITIDDFSTPEFGSKCYFLVNSDTGSLTIKSSVHVKVPGDTLVLNKENGYDNVLVCFIRVKNSTWRMVK